MRLVHAIGLAVVMAVLAPAQAGAQQKPQPMQEDPDRKVAGGGITVPGWMGVVDAAAAKQGKTINDSKFEKQGEALHLAIGPAAYYWNPANVAKGDYTVKATFREPKTSTSHPHPYGIFIGGANPEGESRSLMYCVAYGDGTFLIRRFNGATVTTVAPRAPHAALHKPAADGSVTNEVGWTVKGDRAECVINGQAVAGFPKSEIVGPGKLESTDGIYGLRVSHNLDVVVSGLAVTK